MSQIAFLIAVPTAVLIVGAILTLHARRAARSAPEPYQGTPAARQP